MLVNTESLRGPAGLRLLENVVGDATDFLVRDAQLLELDVAVGGHGPLTVVDNVHNGLLHGVGLGEQASDAQGEWKIVMIV